MKVFDAAFRHILDVERGYVNHPLDGGGPTKYGVTLATLAAHRGEATTAEDVAALTENEAQAIYLMGYWRVMGLDALTSPVLATILLDQGVNRGPRVAVRMLQNALQSTFAPSLAVDGVLGAETAVAANSAPEGALSILLVIEAQRGYLELWRANPARGAFLLGWFGRTWKLLGLTISGISVPTNLQP